MDRVLHTPLRCIPTANGDVRHALKASDPGFTGFGEAYFSTVQQGAVKGWKRHRRMTLNLVVPCGEIRFVIHDVERGEHQSYDLTPDRPDCYARLTIAPGLWVAFGGVAVGLNLLINIADLPHDPEESETRSLGMLEWTWATGR